MVSICKSCHLSTPSQMVNAECKLSLSLFQISCCLSCYSSHNLQHRLNIVQTTIPLLSIDLSSLSPLSFCSWLARHFTMFVLLLCLLPFLIDLSTLYFFPFKWNLFPRKSSSNYKRDTAEWAQVPNYCSIFFCFHR